MEELLNSSFKNVYRKSIIDFINTKSTIKMVRGCYGITNEIDYVFSTILKENLPIDDTSIVLVHDTDLIEVLDACNRLDIKANYRMGIPLSLTNPGILLKYILELMDNYYGVDAYRRLFESDAFFDSKLKEFFLEKNPFDENDYKVNERKYKEFIKCLGYLKLDFKGTHKVYKELYDESISLALDYFDKELKKGIVSFIKTFGKNITKADNQAILKIESVLEEIFKYEIEDEKIKELLEELLKTKVAPTLFNQEELNITTIDLAFNSIRNNTFIIGLDSDYPKNPKENYLIFDEEYLKVDEKGIFTSLEIVKQKEEILKALLKVSSNTYITYPVYTLSDLKDETPSSLISSYVEEFKKENETPYGFKDSLISKNTLVINDYLNNEMLDIKEVTKNIIPFDVNTLLKKKYAPSKIYGFLNEGELQFVLENMFGIYIDDSDDVFNVIPANDKGEIIHYLMEGFQKDEVSLKELKDKAEKEWDNFLKKRPPLIDSKKAHDDFINGVEEAYNQDPGNIFDSAEVEYEYRFPNGILVGGRYDRLEKTKNGEYILVDYKTGKKIEHKENDPKSCIQGLLYAEIIEKNRGIKIKEIEFRYPYKGIIKIQNSKENKEYMYQQLEIFKEKILKGDFKVPFKKDGYKYSSKYTNLISLLKKVMVEVSND